MSLAVEFTTGSLWPVIESKSREALASGALEPVDTEELILADHGVDFIVLRGTHLERKHTAADAFDGNPFLPAEPLLYLGDISDSHYCVLNKYSVIDHHTLIVTKHFESQETLLRLRDFNALCTCMHEYDGLGFYNAGQIAGASQTHKHLQMVPLPLSSRSTALPIASLLGTVSPDAVRIRNLPDLPFAHAFGQLSEGLFDDPHHAGEVTYDLYVDMMESLGIRGTRTNGEFQQPAPYNLLVTRSWMLLVPRSAEHYRGLSINGLGFAGSLFVRTEAELDMLIAEGPMAVLSAVSKPRL